MKNHYAINFREESILHIGYGQDKNNWCIIDWILDFKRYIESNSDRIVNVLSCVKESKMEIIRAYTIWSNEPGEPIDKTLPDTEFMKDCIDANCIYLNGDALKFQEIDENGVIYLSCTNDDEVYLETVTKVLSHIGKKIEWNNVPTELQFLREVGMSVTYS